MQLGLYLETTQQLQLVITPELRQGIQMLQFSALELEAFIHKQLEENPVFDIDDHAKVNPHTEMPSWENMTEHRVSLIEQLEMQLTSFTLTATQERLCKYLIGSLDERGYLDVEQEEVMKKFAIDLLDWERCLDVLHSLEPAGIGARSLAECLLIQLKRKNHHPLALKIVENHLQEAAMEQWESIAKALHADQKQIEIAMTEIRQCDPEPARQIQTDPPLYIVPDVLVEETRDGILITYNDHLIPTLRIHTDYQQLAMENKEAYQYVKPWLKSARILLKGLEQRRDTIIRVTKAILEYQQAFLTDGPSALKPLTLRKIAQKCDLHESTVSRAARNKYMQTPHGVFPFRTFFPSGIQGQSGVAMSVHYVKRQIQQLINQEPAERPLSDQAIAQSLKKKGLFISRRTVSKYRQELGIPSSIKRRKRKVWNLT